MATAVLMRMNPVTGEVIEELGELFVYPASHYVASQERMVRAIEGIEAELAERLAQEPAPEEATRLIEALIPHLQSYYEAWEAPSLDPFLRYNSRT